MSAKKLDLSKGEYVQIKNRIGNKIEGNFYTMEGPYVVLISPNGEELKWYNDPEDVITKYEERNKTAKELDITGKLARLKDLRWTGDALGSDPEFFVVDSKTEEVIPAFDFLPEQKNSHGNPFWDGFQTEFNISSGSCLDGRVSSMATMIAELRRRAIAHNPRAIISHLSTVEISEEVFNKTSPKHLEFGCSPSKNVYDIKGLELDGTKTRIRNAGGHIHFGLSSSKDIKSIPMFVKNLDKILGVACVALFQSFDNPVRRQYYGLAGEYRTPSHGLEYRTLTNAWAMHPRLMYIVFELARKCIALEQVGLSDVWDASQEEVIECINNCDVNMAKNILMINEEVFRAILHSMAYKHEQTVNVLFNTFMQGAEFLIPNPENVFNNWSVGSTSTKRIWDLRAEVDKGQHSHLAKRIKY